MLVALRLLLLAPRPPPPRRARRRAFRRGRWRCSPSRPASRSGNRSAISSAAIRASRSCSCWSASSISRRGRARDGTLLVCLACFLIVTPFFYSQSLLAARAAAAGAAAARRDAAGAGAAVAARPAAFRVARAAVAHARSCSRRAFRSPSLLFVLFPRLAGPLWGLPADTGGELGPVRPDGARDRSASCRCPTPSRFASTSTARCRRRAQRYWRGPVLSRFDGREWTLGPQRPAGDVRAARRARRSVYTVTLEPHWQAVAVRARPARQAAAPRTAIRRRRSAADASAMLTRDQQLVARDAGHAAAALPADVGPARRLSGGDRRRARARDARRTSQLPTSGAQRQSAHASRSRASCARSIRTTPTTSTPCSTGSARSRSSTRWRRRCFRTRLRSTASCSTRGAASASTTRARSSCCCARPAFPRASSPATRAARSIRTAAT